MHLLYCDETNLAERGGDFLIYGGLMVEAEQALALSHALDDLRADYCVPRDYRLKFNPGPDGFSHEQFIAIKQNALEIADVHGARLLAYVILHDIARSPDEARRNGINTVCYHFQCVLNRLSSAGLVLIDRFNDEGNEIDGHLRDKFMVGLTDLPYCREMRLQSILGFHYSAVGQSHFPSVVDVALGSFRFALNAHTRGLEQNMDTARALLGLLSPLFWRAEEEEAVPELGLLFSPKIIRHTEYRGRYERLKAFLDECGIPTTQPITGQRQY